MGDKNGWVNQFGPKIAADLRMVYLWRPSTPREVLEVLVQTRRNKRAALKLMRKLLKKYGFVADKLVTDDLRSRREPDVQEICYVLYLAT
jgi:transposase-like protein